MMVARLCGATVAILLCLLAALPASAEARRGLDRSFGENGVVDLTPTVERIPGLKSYAVNMAVGPDGKPVVLETAYGCEGPASCRVGLIVSRYRVDGSLDHDFGDGGATVLRADGKYGLGSGAMIAVDAKGRILIATREGDTISVIRLDAAGHRDAAYGEQGTATVFGGTYEGSGAMVATASGQLTVASSWTERSPERPVGVTILAVTRLGPDGRPEPGFGASGTARLRLAGAHPFGPMAVQPGGGIVVAGSTCCRDLAPPYVARIRPDGTLDDRFRSTGLGRAAKKARRFEPSAVFARRGGVVELVGSVMWDDPFGRRGGFMARLRPDGTPQRRFGHRGARFPTSPIDAAAIDPHGRIFGVAKSYEEPDLVAFRFKVGGAVDRSFGGLSGIALPSNSSVGRLVTSFSKRRPLVFDEHANACRTSCPPQPIMVRFYAGSRSPHRR